MPTCPKCNARLEEGALYCPADGTPIEGGVQAAVATAETQAVRAPFELAPLPGTAPDSLPGTASESSAGPAEPSTGPSGIISAPPPVPAGAGDDLVGQIIDRRYRVISRLGAGGIGHVYYAEHVQTRRTVAVKVLHQELAMRDEYRLRFEREAQAASALTHPSCVSIIDFGSHGDRSYLVMEYVEGQVLNDWLDQGPAPLGEVVEITLQVLAALRHAHELGIVHRDIKPDNIMLCEPDLAGTRVKILDFGLAKNLMLGEPGSQQLTTVGTVCGTPSYLAPEQASAFAVDTRADLYSLGVVLFLMACGRKPFVSDDPMELIVAHQSRPPPRARELRPEISEQLEAVIDRALQKDPDDRYQTAEAMTAELERVPERRAAAAAAARAPAASASGGSGPSQWSLRMRGLKADLRYLVAVLPQRARQRWPAALGVAAVLLCGLAALVIWAASGPDDGDAGSTATATATETTGDKGTKQRPGRSTTAPREPPPPIPEVPDLDDRELKTHLQRATDSLRRGHLDRAEEHVRRALRRDKHSAAAHLLQGHVHYGRLWCSDAVKEYSKAIGYDRELRTDEGLIKRAVRCLERRNRRAAYKASWFLVHRVGEPALPALKQLAAGHRDAAVRHLAAYTLRQIEQ